MAFYVYILASGRNGTLYVGHTDDLIGRVWRHRNKVHAGFTARYGVDRLVWWEAGASREGAKLRESRIKKWRRAWKIELIERNNPAWRDLYDGLL